MVVENAGGTPDGGTAACLVLLLVVYVYKFGVDNSSLVSLRR